MELTIFDVDHGFCALLIGDQAPGQSANVVLFDCGHNAAPSGFRPSTFLPALGITGIEKLIISHYDEDHVSDLPALRTRLPIQTLYTNRSMTPEQVRQLKLQSGPLEPGVDSAIRMTAEYSGPVSTVTDAVLNPAGVQLQMFRLSYPLFDDPNNLSLVTFIHHPSVSIIIPGDLETAGWKMLLDQADFRAALQRVSVFVTSHHGRSNGYCGEIFGYCTPEIFITSDTLKQYGTQEQRYDQHATGIPWNGGPERRFSLTTRSDNHIRLTTKPEGGYHIQTNALLF